MTGTSLRRVGTLVVAMALATATLVATGIAPAAGATNAASFAATHERVSVATDGTQADALSLTWCCGGRPAPGGGQQVLSRDARYVVFESSATNLVSDADGSANRTDVFVRDRSAGTTVRVAGGTASTWGGNASISDDGAVVAFESNSGGYAPGGCEGITAVYVSQGASVTPVTPIDWALDSSGGVFCTQISGGGWAQVSGNGSAVAYVSDWNHATNSRNSRGRPEVYVHDLGGGYEQVSIPVDPDAEVSVPGDFALTDYAHPRISRDGSKVLFLSRLDNFAPDKPDGNLFYAYVRDRTVGTTELVSRNSAGDPVPVLSASLSPDGTHVAFDTTSPDNAAGDTTFLADVYLRDLVDDTTTLVSVRADGGQFGGGARSPAVSDGGTLVAFRGIEQTNEPEALWARDLLTDETFVVSRNTSGGLSETGGPAVSGNGAAIAFHSTASLLVDNDTNGVEDVFVAAREACPTEARAARTTAQETTCPTNDIELLELEVSQGVQNLRGDVPLLTGRRTWVRAHVRATVSDMSGVSARLRVRSRQGGDVHTILQPLYDPIVVYADPNRGAVRESFVFQIHESMTLTGDLVVELLPGTTGPEFLCHDAGEDCRREVPLSRAPGPNAVFEIWRVQWTDTDGNDHLPTVDDMADAAMSLRTTLPVAGLDVTLRPMVWVWSGPPPLQSVATLTPLTRALQRAVDRSNCRASGAAFCYTVVLIEPAPQEMTGVRDPEAEGDKTVSGLTPSSFWAGHGTMSVATYDTVALTVPHETGHGFTMDHVGSGDRCAIDAASVFTDDENYVFNDGRLGADTDISSNGWAAGDDPQNTFWGLDVYAFHHTRIAPHPSRYSDLMTYCNEVWTSHYTWARIMEDMDDRFGPEQSGRDSWADRTSAAATGLIDVSAIVDTGASALVVRPASASEPTVAPVQSDTLVRFLDRDGVVLAETHVDRQVMADSADQLVQATLSMPEATASVALAVGGDVVASVTASASAPTVSIQPPGLSSDGSRIELAWTVSDPDGDPIDAEVDYSVDGGATFMMLTAPTSNTTLSINRTDVPGGDLIFRVTASDGFHAASATSAPLTLPDQPPTLAVPRVPPVGSLGSALTLHALAFDPEDGRLSGDSVSWSSNLDGDLGNGADLQLPYAALRPGEHTITAHAVDSHGKETAASLTFSVEPVTASVTRLSGPSRLDTARTVSQDIGRSGEAGAVVLARSDVFADALAGTPLAAKLDGPLLLSDRTSLSPEAESELRRVLPSGGTAYLLGGEAALSSEVAQRVTALGYEVVRLGGTNRYETAVKIAEAIGEPEAILLATGQTFPDALAAGTAAAAVGGTVVLTDGETLAQSTRDYLAANPSAKVYAIGGPASRAAPSATPIVGTNRFDTTLRVARTFLPNAVVLGVASGANFPDALAGGAHLARLGGALLLVEPGGIPADVAAYLDERSGRVLSAYVYGGTSAVAKAVEDGVANLLR